EIPIAVEVRLNHTACVQQQAELRLCFSAKYSSALFVRSASGRVADDPMLLVSLPGCRFEESSPSITCHIKRLRSSVKHTCEPSIGVPVARGQLSLDAS